MQICIIRFNLLRCGQLRFIVGQGNAVLSYFFKLVSRNKAFFCTITRQIPESECFENMFSNSCFGNWRECNFCSRLFKFIALRFLLLFSALPLLRFCFDDDITNNDSQFPCCGYYSGNTTFSECYSLEERHQLLIFLVADWVGSKPHCLAADNEIRVTKFNNRGLEKPSQIKYVIYIVLSFRLQDSWKLRLSDESVHWGQWSAWTQNLFMTILPSWIQISQPCRFTYFTICWTSFFDTWVK